MKPVHRVVLAAALAVVPRTAVSYLAYVSAPLLLVSWVMAPWQVVTLAVLIAYAALGLLVASDAGSISVTSFALEMALIAPFLLFLLRVKTVGGIESAVRFLRIANIAVAAFSIVKMPVEGIPYLTVLPDYWNGFFGLGGAKIVTILGFFGLLQELLLVQHKRRASRISLVASVANFVLPSYLLGLACGALALAVAYIRSGRVVALLLVMVLPLAAWVGTSRIEAFNTSATQLTGEAPKAFAYRTALDVVFSGDLLGAGVGQLASTPQTWVDPGLAGGSAHSIPSLPGLMLSDAYRDRVASYTAVGNSNAYALSSSLNQPVAGWASLVGEWGLASIAFFGLLFARMRALRRRSALAAAAVFLVAVNSIDIWYDSPWFSASLIALFGVGDILAREPEGASILGLRAMN